MLLKSPYHLWALTILCRNCVWHGSWRMNLNHEPNHEPPQLEDPLFFQAREWLVQSMRSI